MWIIKKGQGLLWKYHNRSRLRSSRVSFLKELVIRKVVVRDIIIGVDEECQGLVSFREFVIRYFCLGSSSLGRLWLGISSYE